MIFLFIILVNAQSLLCFLFRVNVVIIIPFLVNCIRLPFLFMSTVVAIRVVLVVWCRVGFVLVIIIFQYVHNLLSCNNFPFLPTTLS